MTNLPFLRKIVLPNLFLDLDGTLIDSRRRIYNLFQEMLPESQLSFDEYWKIKRSRVSQEKLLTERFCFDPEAVQRFKADWLAKIEEPDF